MEPVKDLMTSVEAAEYLRMGPRTLATHRKAGTGPVWYPVAGKALYERADLNRWLDGLAESVGDLARRDVASIRS